MVEYPARTLLNTISMKTLTGDKKVLSVSQLNHKAKQILEIHLTLVWVSGEISNLVQASSGHWYLTLKDTNAQVRCAMFRNANQRLRWRPKNGDHVLIRARVSLYEGRGDYQLIVEHMEAEGSGALQQAYEALKQKLLTEGLFDEKHKKPLPPFPRNIGVITSPTGAAIRDIISVIQRRAPHISITVIPTLVQGDSAADAVIEALNKAEQQKHLDLLIISRGGGSIEDLWPFNDERLARAIAAAELPIISAVGHETDSTICDFVADYRAPTPSASAEVATPDTHEWQQTLDYRQQQLFRLMNHSLNNKQSILRHYFKRLRDPQSSLALQKQRLSQLSSRIKQLTLYNIDKNKQRLLRQQLQLQHNHPDRLISQYKKETRLKMKTLVSAIQSRLSMKAQQLKQSTDVLEAISPLAVLNRGYAMAFNDNNEIIHDSKQVNIDDTVTIKVSKGVIKGKVIEKE